MLQTLNVVEFLSLLSLNAATMRSRCHIGDGAFALGLKKNPHRDVYLVLDALGWIMASMLGREIGLHQAAEVIRLSWDAWLRALQVVEHHWDEYERGAIPVSYQMVVGVGVAKDRAGRVEVGPKYEVEAKLAGYEGGDISVNLALRMLKENAKRAAIVLPDKLTVHFDHADHGRWRQELEAYRKLGEMRFREKMKLRKVRAAAAQRPTFTVGASP
jgi:hypothetical protein